jgi:hypothetical protein
MRQRTLVIHGAVVLLVGTAAAVHAATRPRPDEAAVRGLVAEVARSVAAGDVDAVWRSLAPDTRERFERGHAVLQQASAWYAERTSDPILGSIAVQCVRENERLHGMSGPELAAIDARGLWLRHTRENLGARGEEFGELEIVECRTDGARATVRARLPHDVPQGFHCVRTPEGWRLVDFAAFRPLEHWRTLAAAGR